MKQASKANLESLLGIDADQVRVSAQGVTTGAHGVLQSAPAQAGKAQPASAPVSATRAADIDAVVLVQGYSMTGVGGAILLKVQPGGAVWRRQLQQDARRALQGDARIDGRWHRTGGGWALTDQKGKTTQVKASMRALPAGRGSRLQGSYRSLGGVGAPGQDVAVVSAWSAMQFARDGSVQMGQGAGRPPIPWSPAPRVERGTLRARRPRHHPDLCRRAARTAAFLLPAGQGGPAGHRRRREHAVDAPLRHTDPDRHQRRGEFPEALSAALPERQKVPASVLCNSITKGRRNQSAAFAWPSSPISGEA